METAGKTVMAYFPGCSLHGAANDFATSIKVLMDALDIELREIEDWCCCGASSAHKVSAKAAQGLVTVNIDSAQNMGLDTIFAPCAACYNRLRVVADETHSPVKVVNLPDLIAANIDKILAKQTRKLDMKIGCYYGCLLNKPAAVFKEDCENPMTMENSLKALGMTSVDWPFKTECCGASFSLAAVNVVHKLSGDILKDSLKRGAEIIVTSCPLCHVNLDMRQAEIRKLNRDMGGIPVLYLSELIALCMGVPAKELKLGAHFVAMPGKFEEKFSICHA
jgi:heterodisulfide reductase subunit B